MWITNSPRARITVCASGFTHRFGGFVPHIRILKASASRLSAACIRASRASVLRHLSRSMCCAMACSGARRPRRARIARGARLRRDGRLGRRRCDAAVHRNPFRFHVLASAEVMPSPQQPPLSRFSAKVAPKYGGFEVEMAGNCLGLPPFLICHRGFTIRIGASANPARERIRHD